MRPEAPDASRYDDLNNTDPARPVTWPASAAQPPGT